MRKIWEGEGEFIQVYLSDYQRVTIWLYYKYHNIADGSSYGDAADIKGKEYCSTATGEIHEGTKIRLREIKIGDSVLRNVEASVTHNQQAPLLLGQSVLERFGTITIDNINSRLIIKQK